VLDFINSSSGTRASPLLLLGVGGDDPDDPPSGQEDACYHCPCVTDLLNILQYEHFFFSFSEWIIWNHPPHFSIAFMGKYVSTYSIGLGTHCDVTSGMSVVPNYF
jgi:hypothetical protein